MSPAPPAAVVADDALRKQLPATCGRSAARGAALDAGYSLDRGGGVGVGGGGRGGVGGGGGGGMGSGGSGISGCGGAGGGSGERSSDDGSSGDDGACICTGIRTSTRISIAISTCIGTSDGNDTGTGDRSDDGTAISNGIGESTSPSSDICSSVCTSNGTDNCKGSVVGTGNSNGSILDIGIGSYAGNNTCISATPGIGTTSGVGTGTDNCNDTKAASSGDGTGEGAGTGNSASTSCGTSIITCMGNEVSVDRTNGNGRGNSYRFTDTIATDEFGNIRSRAVMRACELEQCAGVFISRNGCATEISDGDGVGASNGEKFQLASGHDAHEDRQADSSALIRNVRPSTPCEITACTVGEAWPVTLVCPGIVGDDNRHWTPNFVTELPSEVLTLSVFDNLVSRTSDRVSTVQVRTAEDPMAIVPGDRLFAVPRDVHSATQICREHPMAPFTKAALQKFDPPADNAPGIRAGVRRRSSARIGARSNGMGKDPNLLHVEPVLLELQGYDPRHRACIYNAAEYCGQVYRIGEHVSLLYEGSGVEWIVVIEGFYATNDNVPMFHGRWYWTLDDVRDHNKSIRLPKGSRLTPFERVSTDARDRNPVESILGRITILSQPRFEALFKKYPALCEGLYFCHRMYSTEDGLITILPPEVFPGDLVPEQVLLASIQAWKAEDVKQVIATEATSAPDGIEDTKIMRHPSKRRRVEGGRARRSDRSGKRRGRNSTENRCTEDGVTMCTLNAKPDSITFLPSIGRGEESLEQRDPTYRNTRERNFVIEGDEVKRAVFFAFERALGQNETS